MSNSLMMEQGRRWRVPNPSHDLSSCDGYSGVHGDNSKRPQVLLIAVSLTGCLQELSD
ncbi:hypothetical protein HAX54_011184, partial [Datura stramonium]|nr:hypothetical protein [Datura stramonium]